MILMGKGRRETLKKIQKDIFILNFNIGELQKLGGGNLK